MDPPQKKQRLVDSFFSHDYIDRMEVRPPIMLWIQHHQPLILTDQSSQTRTMCQAGYEISIKRRHAFTYPYTVSTILRDGHSTPLSLKLQTAWVVCEQEHITSFVFNSTLH